MLGTILHGPRDVRLEDVPEPSLVHPTDAIIRLSATCICGSDLWPYRGVGDVTSPMAMGHEYCGIVEEVGNAVTSLRPGSDLPLSEVAEGYRAMDGRRAIKTLLRP